VNGLDNTLYYTFSTIAQTLAGALGLVVALIVIRVGAFNKLLHDHSRDLYRALSDVPSDGGELRSYYYRGDKPAFFKLIYDKYKPSITPEQMEVLREAKDMQRRKDALTSATAWALYPSVATIFLCFVALATVHWLKTKPCYAYIGLSLITGGAVYCLLAYVRLLHRALREA